MKNKIIILILGIVFFSILTLLYLKINKNFDDLALYIVNKIDADQHRDIYLSKRNKIIGKEYYKKIQAIFNGLYKEHNIISFTVRKNNDFYENNTLKIIVTERSTPYNKKIYSGKSFQVSKEIVKLIIKKKIFKKDLEIKNKNKILKLDTIFLPINDVDNETDAYLILGKKQNNYIFLIPILLVIFASIILIYLLYSIIQYFITLKQFKKDKEYLIENIISNEIKDNKPEINKLEIPKDTSIKKDQIQEELSIIKKENKLLLENTQSGFCTLYLDNTIKIQKPISNSFREIFNQKTFSKRTFLSLFENIISDKYKNIFHDFLELLFIKDFDENELNIINPFYHLLIENKNEKKEYYNFTFSQIKERKKIIQIIVNSEKYTSPKFKNLQMSQFSFNKQKELIEFFTSFSGQSLKNTIISKQKLLKSYDPSIRELKDKKIIFNFKTIIHSLNILQEEFVIQIFFRTGSLTNMQNSVKRIKYILIIIEKLLFFLANMNKNQSINKDADINKLYNFLENTNKQINQV